MSLASSSGLGLTLVKASCKGRVLSCFLLSLLVCYAQVSPCKGWLTLSLLVCAEVLMQRQADLLSLLLCCAQVPCDWSIRKPIESSKARDWNFFR